MKTPKKDHDCFDHECTSLATHDMRRDYSLKQRRACAGCSLVRMIRVNFYKKPGGGLEEHFARRCGICALEARAAELRQQAARFESRARELRLARLRRLSKS